MTACVKTAILIELVLDVATKDVGTVGVAAAVAAVEATVVIDTLVVYLSTSLL